jgi:hypothetical protein
MIDAQVNLVIGVGVKNAQAESVIGMYVKRTGETGNRCEDKTHRLIIIGTCVRRTGPIHGCRKRTTLSIGLTV